MNENIIIADASPTIHRTFKLILNERFSLTFVSGSDELFTVIGQIDPVIIFVDSKLSPLDGYACALKIKEISKAKVVLLYGFFNEIDEKKFSDSLADDTLAKPFEAGDLNNIIKKFFIPVKENSQDLDNQIDKLDELLNTVQMNKLAERGETTLKFENIEDLVDISENDKMISETLNIDDSEVILDDLIKEAEEDSLFLDIINSSERIKRSYLFEFFDLIDDHVKVLSKNSDQFKNSEEERLTFLLLKKINHNDSIFFGLR